LRKFTPETFLHQPFQAVSKRFKFNKVNDFIYECDQKQHTGLLFGDTTLAHIEESILIKPAYGGTVAAFYIVGIDLKLRLREDA
jgi:hypothetical protein